MQKSTDSNVLSWILGGALLLTALVVVTLLVGVNSEADDVTTQTVVNNVSPTVDSLVLKDNGVTVGSGATLTLVSGGTEVVTVTGTVSDDNGVGTGVGDGDLDKLSATLSRTGVTCNSGGDVDNNSCYFTDLPGNCSLGAAVDSTTINYTCNFSVAYYADGTLADGQYNAGDWVAKVDVVDDSAANGTLTQNYEVGGLLALSIPGAINYGTLAREQATEAGNNVDMVITQYGNVAADVEVSGTDMNCDVTGGITAASQKWSLTDVPAGDVANTNISGVSTDTNLGIGYRTNDGSPLTKTIYWNLIMPTVASGTCTGTNTITAIAS
jgi:hypothetical protein